MGAPKEVFYHNPPDLPTFLSQNTLHKNTHEKMGVSDETEGLTSPLFFERVGYEAYLWKGGRR